MSEPGDTRRPQGAGDEPFLERWSRRKREASQGIDEEEAPPPSPGAADAATAPAEPAAVPELPDLDSLGEDSDYSAFMASGVDPSLRRQALRKLFSSPKFNVCDGLDDYCGDWRSWTELGDIVTADMRHHLERAARLAEQMEEALGSPDSTGQVEPAAAVAATAAGPEDAPGTSGPDDPDATDDDTERNA